jgi:hypothetical protein
MRRDGTTPVRRLCTLVYQLQLVGWCRRHCSPPPYHSHEGKLSNQAKQVKMMAPWNAAPGSSHIRAQLQRRLPGILLWTLKMIFLACGPTCPITCGRTMSEMSDLASRIISGDSRWSENAQTHHIKAYNTICEVHVELLHIRFKYKFYKRWKLQKIASKDKQWLAESFSLTISTFSSP